MAEALLVIDVEGEYGWTGPRNRYEPPRSEIAANLQEILAKARSDDATRIFISYPSFSSDSMSDAYQLIPGQIPERDWKHLSFRRPKICLACEKPEPLASFLRHRHDRFEPVFFKNAGDAFTNLNLTPYLKNKQVTDIILTGCSTNVCVLDTACGAVSNGFNVKLLRNCAFPPIESDDCLEDWLRTVRSMIPRSLRNVLSAEIV